MPDENAEVISLLREIRDLQRAHFERYKEFTAVALAQQDEATERQRQSLAGLRERDEQVAREQMGFRAEVLADNARARTVAIIVGIASALVQAIIIGIVAFFALALR